MFNMTPHNKFLEFLDTVESEQTEVVIESVPADKHRISTIEINGEAQVLNVNQYNAVAESFKKVIELLQAEG